MSLGILLSRQARYVMCCTYWKNEDALYRLELHFASAVLVCSGSRWSARSLLHIRVCRSSWLNRAKPISNKENQAQRLADDGIAHMAQGPTTDDSKNVSTTWLSSQEDLSRFQVAKLGEWTTASGNPIWPRAGSRSMVLK